MCVTLVLCDINSDKEDVNVQKSIELGSYEYLSSAFTVISDLLEDGNWGSKYPILLEGLEAHTQFNQDVLEEFLIELDELREELKKYSPKDVIDSIHEEGPIDKTAENIYELFLTEEDEENLIETFYNFTQEAVEDDLNLRYIFS